VIAFVAGPILLSISDACLGSISKLKRLSYILLSGTSVTEQGANELRRNLPNLEVERR
jgi:hypothetical protein